MNNMMTQGIDGDEEQIQNPGAIKRVALLNDLTAFGRCSLAVAVPVVSAFGFQACPIPTAILSNHLGFRTYSYDDYTPKIRGVLDGLETLGVCFDAIACGFLGSDAQIPLITRFLEIQSLNRTSSPLFCLDPVMGDQGELYSTITSTHVRSLQDLAAKADLLTPNLTEACLLTDTPYHSGEWKDGQLAAICEKLEERASDSVEDIKIVITGLWSGECVGNYIWENHSGSRFEIERSGDSRPGTGDLFAAVLLSLTLQGFSFAEAVKRAAKFVALSIGYTHKRGVPQNEGVLFEPLLSRVMRGRSESDMNTSHIDF
ncbi:MAG: bifunctional hydroxymethylpyrimidine kinase/phosphomethylpyrimidine kinase [Lachnospiraceae bacterium]|jgi:pyridoxine kinase|nr:bifunctional hydroxymethylpyrimidine kinase/phosphomethylpyrimidine kinase [Lachnospiraceae bacterium]